MQLKPTEQARLDELNTKGYRNLNGAERAERATLKGMMEAPEPEGKPKRGKRAKAAEAVSETPTEPATAEPVVMPEFKTAEQPTVSRRATPPTDLANALRIPEPGTRFRHATLFDSIDPRVHSVCVILAADAEQVAYAAFVGSMRLDQRRTLGTFPTAHADSHVKEWVKA